MQFVAAQRFPTLRMDFVGRRFQEGFEIAGAEPYALKAGTLRELLQYKSEPAGLIASFVPA